MTYNVIDNLDKDKAKQLKCVVDSIKEIISDIDIKIESLNDKT